MILDQGGNLNPTPAVMGVDYEMSSAGLSKALDDGCRWLQIPRGFGMTEPLDLDRWTHATDLRIDSGGPNIANLERAFGGGSLIRCSAVQWRIYSDGVSIDGRADLYPGPENHTWDIANSFLSSFKRGKVIRSGGHGFRLTGAVQAIDFDSYHVHDGKSWAFWCEQATDLHWTGVGSIERNADGGIFWVVPSGQEVTGPGSIRTHFEENGTSIDLRGVHAVRVVGSYSYLGEIRWDAECRKLHIADNLLLGSNLVGDRNGHVIANNDGDTYTPAPPPFSVWPWWPWRTV